VAELTLGGTTVTDTLNYFVRPEMSVMEELPAGLTKGVNYIGDDSVVIVLFAPNKSTVFLISEITDYQLDIDFMCRKTSDDHFWLPIGGLNEKQEYAYAFFIDEGIVVADPYSDKILDFNDRFINQNLEIYPNLKPYPEGKVDGPVSVFEINRDEYEWQTTDYVRPNKEDLVIYELLVRDFAENSDYQTVIDSLNYLDSLGVNAIQLMPIMEFNGNISWGYNPTFFMAPDKAYGTREKLKEFIDKCHARGMAVILDIALNHAEQRFPYAFMAYDRNTNQTTPDNPFFNPQPRHPFNVFNDFNHEYVGTQEYVDDVNRFWIEEYRIDGYRFDLSKGFTQRNSLGNQGLWDSFDQSRIDLLTRMANKIWEVDPNSFVILEHFGGNQEETVLANAGMMPWGSQHTAARELAFGFTDGKTDLTGGYYANRGWNDPNLVAYMVSHDEERIVTDALRFGNQQNPNHDTRELEIALERLGATSALFYSIPGPKMLWQFDELGYDFSINYCSNGTISGDCRTDPKPVRWDYFEDENRRSLYNITSELIKLKKTYPIFRTRDVFISDFNGTDGGVDNAQPAKFVKLTHQPFTDSPTNADEMNLIVMANLDVVSRTFTPAFHHTGDWFEHFTDETLNVTDVNAGVELAPGEFRIYTDFDLPSVSFNDDDNGNGGGGVTSIENEVLKNSIRMFPNPSSSKLNMTMSNEIFGAVSMRIVALTGQEMTQRSFTKSGLSLSHTFEIDALPAGLYILQVQTTEGNASQLFVKQ